MHTRQGVGKAIAGSAQLAAVAAAIAVACLQSAAAATEMRRGASQPSSSDIQVHFVPSPAATVVAGQPQTYNIVVQNTGREPAAVVVSLMSGKGLLQLKPAPPAEILPGQILWPLTLEPSSSKSLGVSGNYAPAQRAGAEFGLSACVADSETGLRLACAAAAQRLLTPTPNATKPVLVVAGAVFLTLVAGWSFLRRRLQPVIQ